MKIEVQKALEAIYARDGSLSPSAVVTAAKNKKSPLHPWFQWDDGEAAQAWRLHQARNLIRVAVTVIPSISNKPVKQFVSISTLRGKDDGSYLATVDVISDEERYTQAKEDALRALSRLEVQYRHIVELSHIWAAITAAAETALAEAA